MSADPSLLKLVPDSSGARVVVRGQLVHRCPHRPEVDTGVVTITWVCGDATLELHALAAYLASWASVVVSSEEITAQIRRDLERFDGDGIEEPDAATDWRTAGLDLHVEALDG